VRELQVVRPHPPAPLREGGSSQSDARCAAAQAAQLLGLAASDVAQLAKVLEANAAAAIVKGLEALRWQLGLETPAREMFATCSALGGSEGLQPPVGGASGSGRCAGASYQRAFGTSLASAGSPR